MSEENFGMIHIYCGDGKGKTTAGMGLCARAAGRGSRVLICQFMKDNSSGERSTLELSDNISFQNGPEQEKFSFHLTLEEKEERKTYYEQQFRAVTERAVEEEADLLFLDEVIYAIGAGMLDEQPVLDFLNNKPTRLEVIMTGRDPDQALLDKADYVSEIKKIKHPFDKGIPARDGIER